MDRRDAIKRLLGGAAIVAVKQLPEGVAEDDDALERLADLVTEKIAGKINLESLAEEMWNMPCSQIHPDSLVGGILLRNGAWGEGPDNSNSSELGWLTSASVLW